MILLRSETIISQVVLRMEDVEDLRVVRIWLEVVDLISVSWIFWRVLKCLRYIYCAEGTEVLSHHMVLPYKSPRLARRSWGTTAAGSISLNLHNEMCSSYCRHVGELIWAGMWINLLEEWDSSKVVFVTRYYSPHLGEFLFWFCCVYAAEKKKDRFLAYLF